MSGILRACRIGLPAAYWALAVIGCAGAPGRDLETDGLGLGPASTDGSGSDTSVPIDSADSGMPICGNGEVDDGEDCDDGNDDDTDACTHLCAAPSCEDGIASGDETDVDCGGGCSACGVGSDCGAGADCDTGVCLDGSCGHAISCQDLLAHVPDTPDGPATIDPDGPGGLDPFGVSCDMSTAGGGWIRLSLQHSDGVVVGQNGADNPWTKCEDDGAKHFGWIDEGTISADISPGANFDEEVALSYQNPGDGTIYESAQVEVLRGVISELHESTRMVAMTADDDNVDWHNEMVSGHEVYIMGASGRWTLLTPGTNGECGGSTGFPEPGSESAFYLWSDDFQTSAIDGMTGLSGDALPGLGGGDLLPSAVRLVVQTGGGVAFGWEQVVFLVR